MKLKAFLIFATLLVAVGVFGQANVVQRVSTSGFNQVNDHAEFIIDGNATTCFTGTSVTLDPSTHNPTGGQGTITLDLGMPISVRSIKVKLQLLNWCTPVQNIGISSDGVHWGPIPGKSITNLAYNDSTSLWDNSQGKVSSTRYIQISYKYTSSSNILNMKVYEITVTPDVVYKILTYAYDGRGSRISRSITLGIPVAALKSASIFDSTAQVIKKDFIPEPENTFTDAVGQSKVSIYPNPTRGELVVQVSNPSTNEQTRRIMLYDLNGMVIYQRDDATEYTDVDITTKPSGVYILKIYNGTESTTWKIIKQ